MANTLQDFRGDVAVWANLDHQNILRCFGVTIDPFQIMTEWMPNGEAMQYVRERQDADRVLLVSSPATNTRKAIFTEQS